MRIETSTRFGVLFGIAQVAVRGTFRSGLAVELGSRWACSSPEVTTIATEKGVVALRRD